MRTAERIEALEQAILALGRMEFDFNPDELRDPNGKWTKGEWESEHGQPRLAPLEKRKTGEALPYEMITMSVLPKEIQDKVMKTINGKVASPEEIDANLKNYLAVALANPELRDSGMNWYQIQHDAAFRIAEENGIPPQNVAAAIASMSSGTLWESELPIIEFMGDHTNGHVNLSQEDIDTVNGKLDATMVVDRAHEVAADAKDKDGEGYAALRSEFPTSEDIKNAWEEAHPDLNADKMEKSLNRPDNTLYGELIAMRENEAGLIDPYPNHISNGDSYKPGDMDTLPAVLSMQREFMAQPTPAEGGTRETGWGAGHGWDGFEKGLNLIRGADVDNTILGPKVRSFTNNIMDPQDPRDVTVDVHMVSAAANDPKIINDSSVMGTPSYLTASIGSYPYIADVIREIAAHPCDGNQECAPILPQQAQALMWVGYKELHP